MSNCIAKSGPAAGWRLTGWLAAARRTPRHVAPLSTTLALVLAVSWSGSRLPAMAQGAAVPQPTVSRPTGGGAWSAQVVAKSAPAAKSRATSIRFSGDAGRTRVRIEVTRSIVASLFTLDAPYRAIIDVADLEFRLPATDAGRGMGLVSAYRYGQFQAGRARVVIDLAGPARIENAAFTPAAGPAPDKSPGALTFDLVQISAAEFAAIMGGSPAASPAPELRGPRHDGSPHSAPAESALPPLPEHAPQKTPKPRPVVVIDPGHGGIDPGTVASATLTEKMVTLNVAIQLRNLLLQGRRYDVQLTRQADTFVSLDQRLRFSRQHAADLFVSIHADALAEVGLAQAVRGATVYVLSDRASDEAARRLADKENAADVLAGLAAMPASVEDQVRSILIDLVQRETANYSATFRGLLLANMRGRLPLAKDPQRSAAFKVLKQPETPAVLIELGYMSNAEDLARLIKPEGQRQLASAIATAIDAFFARRDAPRRR